MHVLVLAFEVQYSSLMVAARRRAAMEPGIVDVWRLTVPDVRRVAELTWVLRPAATRPQRIRALAGTPVHAASSVGVDGEVDLVLRDGTRVRVTAAEIEAE